jgi:tetratricopeptide (TPR) repeat protein
LTIYALPRSVVITRFRRVIGHWTLVIGHSARPTCPPLIPRLPRVLLIAALSLAPASARADLAPALALYAERRYAEAQELFEIHALREPTDAAAHHYLGKLARRRQDLPAALTHLARARELSPADPAILFDYGSTACLQADTLGVSLRAATLARTGRAAMEEAVALAPANLDYRQALLEFYSHAPGLVGGGMSKAYAQAAAIRELDPRRGTFAQANLLIRDRRYDEALLLLRELRAVTPDDYWVLYHLGRTLALARQAPAEGLAALTRCLELPVPENAPAHSRIHWNLGIIHRQENDITAARAAFRAALAIEPHNQQFATELARLPPDSVSP